MTTTCTEWINAFAAKLDIEAPDAATIETLLDLAGVAAHASERIAAPLACWLVGHANVAPDEALRLARDIAP